MVALFFEALALKSTGMSHGGLHLLGTTFLALPFVILVTIAGGSSVLREFESFRKAQTVFDSFFPKTIFAWVLPIPLFTLMLISLLSLMSWSPVSLSSKMNKDYRKLCEDTGVEYFSRPVGKVRSVAYLSSHNQEVVDSKRAEIVLNHKGRFKRTLYSYSGMDLERQLTLKLSKEKSNSARVEDITIKFEDPLYRLSDTLDAVAADILVYYNIKQASYKTHSLKWSGPKYYRMETSDRRSGELLGVMKYVVDRGNKRACGANLENTINEDHFVLTALTR
jgi:hypothetical protein